MLTSVHCLLTSWTLIPNYLMSQHAEIWACKLFLLTKPALAISQAKLQLGTMVRIAQLERRPKIPMHPIRIAFTSKTQVAAKLKMQAIQMFCQA